MTPAAPEDRSSKGERPWLVLVTVGTGTLLGALSGSTVNLALPRIGAEMGATLDQAGWVVTSFLLAITVLLLVGGKAGDLVGHKPIYLAGFSLFGLASLASGLAGSIGFLIAARVAQGIGSAMIMSTAIALLTTTYPGSKRGWALGWLATATYTGLMVGPLVGGWILAALSWRFIFFMNVPAAAIVLALGTAFLPARRKVEGARFDWAGALTLVTGLPMLLVAISEGEAWGWTSPVTIAFGLSGALVMGLFVWIEMRSSRPLLSFDLFRSRIFTGAVLSAMGNYVALFISIILLPYYLMEALGIEPARAGLILSAQPLVMALVASPSGRLSDRIGSRGIATAGLLVLAAGMAGLATVGPGTSEVAIALWLAVMGLGTGVFISPNSSALMGSAPRTQQGVAGGVMAFSRNLGMMLGVAAGITIFRVAGGRTGHEWQAVDYQSLRIALAVASAVCVLSAVAAALRGRGEEGGTSRDTVSKGNPS